MNLSSLDISLYELALSADLPVLQISPATFKSAISTFIDVLVEQEISALVWAKLPRGDIWQAEVDRYSTLSHLSQNVYLFKNYRDEGSEDIGLVNPITASGDGGSSDAADLDQNTIAADLPQADKSPVSWIQLAPNSQLRREYFLIVWSPQLQGAILTHRPRSAQLKAAATNQPLGIEATEVGRLAEESHDRRNHLLAQYSLDQVLVERVIEGLASAKTATAPNSVEASSLKLSTAQAEFAVLSEAAASWRQSIASAPVRSINLISLGHLFTKQLQRQEEIWQRSTTYRRQAEAAEVLQVQNEDLTSNIRVKDDFLNTIGQELRTPLTTIKTALTLLNSPNLKLPQRQRYLDLITKECDRQSSLITSLLDLVQLEQVVDQTVLPPLRIADVVPAVVSTYQPLATEKGVSLTYSIPDELPPVSCMNNWLKQIVINLLHNGIKFTPAGGQVRVRASQLEDYIQLDFRDTGIGIAQSEIPKIFDRFYRTRQSVEETGGAGLGLTIVQQLLIHCGGSISVRSKLGEGSIFSILLPIHKGGPRE